jgi:abhydrolase domain-containing protein 17
MNSKLWSIFIGEFSMRRFWRSLVLIPLAVAAGLLFIALFFADAVIFRPPSSSYQDTNDIIKLRTVTGETISAKFYLFEGAQYTILFSHGNAEDIGIIEPLILELRDSGFNVLTFDYSGYGTSSGSPSEANAYADIYAAYTYLILEKQIPPDRIVLHGRSLGGGVAVNLASREQVGGLILESTFTTAFRVITRYPILPFDKFESIEELERVKCPMLIIHGTNDWTIPIYHAEQLFESASPPKYSYWVQGAGHNNVFDRDQGEYLDSIARFAQTLGSR